MASVPRAALRLQLCNSGCVQGNHIRLYVVGVVEGRVLLLYWESLMPRVTLFPKSFLCPPSRCWSVSGPSLVSQQAPPGRAHSFLALCTHLQAWQARTEEICTLSALDIASGDGREATIPAGWLEIFSPKGALCHLCPRQRPLPSLWGFLCGWSLAAPNGLLYVWSRLLSPGECNSAASHPIKNFAFHSNFLMFLYLALKMLWFFF